MVKHITFYLALLWKTIYDVMVNANGMAEILYVSQPNQ